MKYEYELNPVVGLMRFSTISVREKNSFVSSRENSWDDHVASILDPQRLEFRIRFLLEVTLPQLNNQTVGTSKDWFSFIILISDLLQDEFKEQLYNAQKKYEWLRISERGINDWIAAEKEIKDSLSSMPFYDEARPFMSFRLDDDDTLPLDYIEKCQKHIKESNANKFLTFPNGAKILWSNNGFSIKNFQNENRPFIAIGLGAISIFNFQSKDYSSELKTVFVGINHYQLKESQNFIEDNEDGMYIWSHHASQDTFGKFKSSLFDGEWKYCPENVYAYLSKFPFLIKHIG